ncbi:glycosyltransferase family 4 protein [candidate division KSB1 bacterium]|nr:glycosyltransferase family 4 protein [candidate division KSB1 bacterium]
MKASAGKVLIIVQNLPVPFDRRVWLEAQTLRDCGHHVSIICPKSKEYPESFERIDDIAVYRYKMPVEADGVLSYFFEFTYAWLVTALLSVKVLLREGFDIVQSCNPPDTFFLLGLLYKLIGKKFIFDHHDLAPEMYLVKYNKMGGLLYRGLLFLERLSLRTADIVLTTNESYKKISVKRAHKNSDDVFVLRTGPDLKRLKPVPVDESLKSNRRYLVCYLGEMCPQDGVDYLLESVKYIHNKLGRDDVQFTLIGGGPAQPAFKRKSEEMGLSDFVHFTGRLPDEKLCAYLSTADVCVDPDPLTEWSNYSTMNKVLEYMVFAKPIVCYNLVETKYSAQNAALYIEPNDTARFGEGIVELLDNPGRRAKMGVYGQQRVRNKLCWNHTNKSLKDAYQYLFLKKQKKTAHELSAVKVLERIFSAKRRITSDEKQATQRIVNPVVTCRK